MPRMVTRWVCDDGTEFENESVASNHERVCHIVEAALMTLGRMDCNNKRVHTQETLTKVYDALVRITQPYVRERIAGMEPHRILELVHTATNHYLLTHAWLRLSRCDLNCVEWPTVTELQMKGEGIWSP